MYWLFTGYTLSLLIGTGVWVAISAKSANIWSTYAPAISILILMTVEWMLIGSEKEKLQFKLSMEAGVLTRRFAIFAGAMSAIVTVFFMILTNHFVTSLIWWIVAVILSALFGCGLSVAVVQARCDHKS